MKKFSFLAFTILIIVSCSSKQAENNSAIEKAVAVNTATVKKEKISTELDYSGTIEAFQTIPLSFQSSGTIERVLVDIGDKVTKGQLLATVDESDAKNLYDLSLAKYEQAQDAYDRLKLVYDKGSLPEIKWVEMESNLQQAKSGIELAKNNLQKCKMYAPVDGTIGQRNIEPGMSSLSFISAPLEIVKIKKVFVKISVPENELSKITVGKTARIKVSALNNMSYTGEVTHISPVANKISRTYDAKILVNNINEQLKPGMVCDVKIEFNNGNESVFIPYQSVMRDDNNNQFVYLVNPSNKRVSKQEVTTGQYNESYLEVLSGLSEGQTIVSEGKEKLSDNTLIEL